MSPMKASKRPERFLCILAIATLTGACAEKPDQSICGVGTPYDDRNYEKWRQMQIDAECPDYLRWKKEQERLKSKSKP